MTNRGGSSRNVEWGGGQEESSSRPPAAVSIGKDARGRRRGRKATEGRGVLERPSPSRTTGPTIRSRSDPFGEYQHQSSRRILKREPTGLRISELMDARQDGDSDDGVRRQNEGDVARSDGRGKMEGQRDTTPTSDRDGAWDAAPLKKNVSGSKQRTRSSSDLLSVSTSVSKSRSTVLSPTPRVSNLNTNSRPKLSVRPERQTELGHLTEKENLDGSQTGGSGDCDAEVEMPIPSATPKSLGLIAVEEGRNNISYFDGNSDGDANVLFKKSLGVIAVKKGKNNIPTFDGNDSNSKQLFKRMACSKETSDGKNASVKKEPTPPITPKSLGAVAIDEDGKNNIESNDALGFDSGLGSGSSGKKSKRSSLRKFLPSVVSSITGPSIIKGEGGRSDEVDYGIDPSRGSFDLVIVPKGSGGSGNSREKKKNKRHADAAAAIVATAAANLMASSSSTTAATQSTRGISYWSSLSVRAAVAVMTAGGAEPVAQRAANAVLAAGRAADAAIDLQGLATRVSMVVLEAGGDHRAAASVAVAIMNEAEPSRVLVEKLKGGRGGNIKRDGSGLSDRFGEDHTDEGSPPIKTINEEWLEVGKEGVQSSSTITDPDATIPSETKSMASKRRHLQEKEEEIEVRNRALADAACLNKEKEQAIRERIMSLEAARAVGKRRAQEREAARKNDSAEAKRKAVEEAKWKEEEKRRAAEKAAAERAAAEADAKRRELQKREEEIEWRRKDLEERQRKAEAERTVREEEIRLAKIKLEERQRMAKAERAAREAAEVARLEQEKDARRIEADEAKRLELRKKEVEIERRNKELEERLKAIKREEEELERHHVRQGNIPLDSVKNDFSAMQQEDGDMPSVQSMTATMASKDRHLQEKEDEIAERNKELEEAARSNLQKEQEIRERMAAMEAAAARRAKEEQLLKRQREEEARARVRKGKEDARRRMLRAREEEIARQNSELAEASRVNRQKEQELNDRMAALDAATAALLERASNVQMEIDDRRHKTNALEKVEEDHEFMGNDHIISWSQGYETGVRDDYARPGEFSVATPMGSMCTPPYPREFNDGTVDATGGAAGYHQHFDEAQNKRGEDDDSPNGGSSVSFTKVPPSRPTQESKKKGVFEQFTGKLYSILDVACDSTAWVSNQPQHPRSGGGTTTINTSNAEVSRNDGSSSQNGTATAEGNTPITSRARDDYTAFGDHKGGKAGAASCYSRGTPSYGVADIGAGEEHSHQVPPRFRAPTLSNLTEDQRTPNTLSKAGVGVTQPRNDTNRALGKATIVNAYHQMPDQTMNLATKTSADSNPNRILNQALNMTMGQQGNKSLAQHRSQQDDHPMGNMLHGRNRAPNEMLNQALYHGTNQQQSKNGQLNKVLYQAVSKPQNDNGQASLALNQALHQALDQCATSGQDLNKPAKPPSALKWPSSLHSPSDTAHLTTNPAGSTGLKSKLKVSFLSRKKPFSKPKTPGFPPAIQPADGDSNDRSKPPGIMRTHSVNSNSVVRMVKTTGGPHPRKKATALRTSPSSKYLRRNRMSVSPKNKIVSVGASPKGATLAVEYSPKEKWGPANIMEGVAARPSSPMAKSQVAGNGNASSSTKKGQVFSFSRRKSKLIEL